MLLKSPEGGNPTHKLAQDLPLFAAPANNDTATVDTTPSPLEDKLQTINPDELTPKEALEMLYALKDIGNSSN